MNIQRHLDAIRKEIKWLRHIANDMHSGNLMASIINLARIVEEIENERKDPK